MKNNKTNFIIIALIIIAILSISTTTLAILNPNDYSVGAMEDTGRLGTMASNILGIILVIGIIIAVAGIFIIGIQFMVGSVEEKAQYKQKILPFIVGFVILVAITAIVNIIYRTVTIDYGEPVPIPGHRPIHEIN